MMHVRKSWLMVELKTLNIRRSGKFRVEKSFSYSEDDEIRQNRKIPSEIKISYIGGCFFTCTLSKNVLTLSSFFQ